MDQPLAQIDATSYRYRPCGWLPRRIQISTNDSLYPEDVERRVIQALLLHPNAILNVDVENVMSIRNHKYGGLPLTLDQLLYERLLTIRAVRQLAPTLRIATYLPPTSGLQPENLYRATDMIFFGCYKSRQEKTIAFWKQLRISKLARLSGSALCPVYASINTHYLQGPAKGRLVPLSELRRMIDAVRPWVTGIVWFSVWGMTYKIDWRSTMPWVELVEKLRKEG